VELSGTGVSMQKFTVEVEHVHGRCKRGYTPGDHFVFNGFDTPDRFCGGAYTVLYPVLMTFTYGGTFAFEKDPHCRTDLACPDGGTVRFRVSPVKE
jgi:uncharacterized repeat protein (TIGR04076 family)